MTATRKILVTINGHVLSGKTTLMQLLAVAAMDRCYTVKTFDDIDFATDEEIAKAQNEFDVVMVAEIADTTVGIRDHKFSNHVKRLFVKPESGIERSLHAAVGIAGESGEILDAIKKTWIYNKPLDRENILEECGDLLFYLQALLADNNFTMQEARDHNMEKLAKRYPEGYTDKAAQDRADKQECVEDVISDDGIDLIIEERNEQITKHGWDAAHDDTHTDGALALEAANILCIGLDARCKNSHGIPVGGMCGAKIRQSDRVHQLKVAGALVAAEIDRLRRLDKVSSPATAIPVVADTPKEKTD